MPPRVERLAAPVVAALVSDRLPGTAPRYRELATALRDRVADGSLPEGAQLPPERALAGALALSRVTVASAYRQLRADGWAIARQGAGTFAARPAAGATWAAMARPPVDGVIDLVNAAAEAPPELILAYREATDLLPAHIGNHGYHPGGIAALRAAIADYYRRRGLPTTADQILVTGGGGDGIAVAMEGLVQPGDRVLVEHPTYAGAVEAVQAAGGRCVPVPLDAADPDAFVVDADRAARQSSPTVAYLMPDFSNPTGARATDTGRRTLAATLVRHGVTALVDEVPADLVLDGSGNREPFGVPVPDTATVTVGSLSKVVWGGIRVGWIRADASRIVQLAGIMARRQLSVSVVDQLAAVLLLGDYDHLISRRRSESRRRRDALVDAVSAELPEWSFHVPAGGLSLWCRLPAGTSSTELVASAADRGLRLAPGPRFGTGHLFDDHQRLPYTRPVPELLAAVRILASVATAAPTSAVRAVAPAVTGLVV
ncbi:PLP-dependent aminotransferase family protein [Rhodococcus triatomae]|uniref:DNA-binding transcriptional regulator, MocR family, contains an aminotransferase domain n=1 Tax=Rhodococcus triatomae TaxID=300028 RepID=A0A1G8F590_9NOCA|nr:PLP-dependent aminotransferase family protein [Rhodococcus triatomae]QNG19392.1 PLP-dependent aminotransferase family protein [Rhodococcus triatomae]QNG24695.1 PLP-dependent aminotransferase family protein [Rhodococcus triatomae]SDH77288.1 DNA-binding transcriptional regulator, MocR family, contains an aminotransferase domain [Rhodococcus triatomae]